MDTSNGYLTGTLLIATPSLQEGCFSKAVIYICEHSPGGAMGVIINQPIASVRLAEILKELDLVTDRKIGDLPVYFGGPVEGHRGFVVHTADVVLEDTVTNKEGIALTANIAMLRSIAEGHMPQHNFLVLGYAGWAAGQLEAEIEAGGWITAPATRSLVFETNDEEKWMLSAASLGVDLSRLSAEVGHA
ncbi:MAG: YqgE/AlgH family protein [Alphaproteobacteria bacterium]|nr:YqgE/AlgH family protein [Alphaproteobacteria bacterium]